MDSPWKRRAVSTACPQGLENRKNRGSPQFHSLDDEDVKRPMLGPKNRYPHRDRVLPMS